VSSMRPGNRKWASDPSLNAIISLALIFNTKGLSRPLERPDEVEKIRDMFTLATNRY